jgi:hypothetical protein
MHARVWGALCLLAAFGGRADGQPTYAKEIARITQAKCQRCHRPNDIAPFALTTYEEAQTWAADIKRVVEGRIMPPWKPSPGSAPLRDDFSLTDEERAAIVSWVDAGAPLGDAAELPEALPANESPWQLGEPDVVLSMPEYTPPRAKDTYRCFSIPTDFETARYASAVQALPGDRGSVHHVLLFLDPAGQSARLDGQDGEPGYSCFGGPEIQLTIDGGLGGWAPGMRMEHLADGIGLRIPARTRIVMQVHYHPNGRIRPDRTQIGLYLRAAERVKQRLIYLPVLNTRFEIPPGAENYEVEATFPILPFLTGKAINVAPHMHLLGRRVQVEIRDFFGKKTPLIQIDDWDFNWQNVYTFAEPIRMPAGSTVRVTCGFDNSENNPRNPNHPLQAVRWGEGTEDEMCIGFVGMVFDFDNLLPFSTPRR